MARLESEFTFIGPAGNFSAYRMRGVDGIILRKKGGVSRKRIKNDPNYAPTRHLNAEFGGRSKVTHYILRALHPLNKLRDYNLPGPLNACLRPAQLADTVNRRGERHIALSQHPAVLEGFSLNRKRIFESVVSAPVLCHINRETFSAEVTFPKLIPRVNFSPPREFQHYGFQAALGIVPDHFFTPHGYEPAKEYFWNTPSVLMETPWYTSSNGSESIALPMNIPYLPPDENFTLILTIGLRFGKVGRNGTIEQVPYTGSARIFRAAGKN